MCRLAAYLGSEIALERIVSKPRHSLVRQSRQAEEAKLTVNADGFGMAWYSPYTATPGVFRDVYPAWSDENLLSLCHTVHSSLFLGHVRAATSGGTLRTNCHPFTMGQFCFMHNGKIADFPKIARPLEARLSETLYAQRRGKTDSELMFLLMCAHGLEDDPYHASIEAFRLIIDTQKRQGVVLDKRNYNHVVAVFSDGTRLFAIRHSSDRRSPTLYYKPQTEHGGQCLASEAIDGESTGWQTIEEDCFLVIDENGLEQKPFHP